MQAHMKSTLQHLLSDGKTDQVIAELRRLTAPDPYLHEQFLLLAGRQAELERKSIAGTASADDLDIERNKIREALLVLVKKLPEEGTKTVTPQPIVDVRNVPRHLTAPPFLSEVFVGRKEDIQHIHERLFSAEGHLLLLVNGEGGIGKTTLAARYYHEHCDEYQHVAWVLSERSIALAVLMLAAPLGVEFEDTMDTEERFQVLLAVLANLPKPCLLVVDNANELEDLETYYPQLQRCTNFHVLFTTRVNEYAAAAFYKIPPLPMELALLAFREHYKAFEPTEEPVFRELYEAVGGNTLVLELFAKNLHHFNTKLKKRYLLTELRQDVEKSLLRLSSSEAVSIRYQAKGGQRTAKPEEVIAAMYDLSALPDEEQALLSVLAVLPAERIPYDLLERLLAQETAARFADMDRHLLSLAQKGWLDYSDAGNSFKISPVIQEVTKAKNAERLLDDCRILVNTLMTGLDEDNRHQDNYQQAAVFARLGEAVIFGIPLPDVSLSVLCQNIGNYHSDTGNLSLMMQAYQKMLEIQTAFLEAEPDNAGFKNGLAISYSKLGETHSALGDLQQALRCFEDYNRLEKELHEDFPQHVEFKNNLAISYSKLGETHNALGDLRQALGYFEAFYQLEKELYEVFSKNVEYKNNLAISYSKLGETHSALGNLQQALRYFEAYNQLEKELYEDSPQNVEFKNGLAVSYQYIGNTHRALGDLQQTLGYFEDYNRLKKELYEAFPQNVSFKNGLAISYEKLGETHSALGDLQQALGYFGKDIELSKELHEAFPQVVDYKNNLAVSYSKLGEAHSALGDLQQALTYFEERNRLGKELHEAFPQNVAFKNGLAVSYCKLAEVSIAKGDKQQAKALFRQAEALWQELVRDAPHYVQFQRFLGMVQEDLAGLE
jgi:tetratricopeptide (TPR) repeat protein